VEKNLGEPRAEGRTFYPVLCEGSFWLPLLFYQLKAKMKAQRPLELQKLFI